jgi:uracil-DNA glycosylase
MDEHRRDQYLKSLGVEQWVPRAAADASDGRTPEPAPAPALSAPVAVAAPPATAAAVAREVPADWDALRAMVRDCRQCRLCEARTQSVFGVGVPDADLMVVGEGPGAEEDAKGEPFVGRAGRLLDEMLKAIGRSRHSNTFIANVVKCRPPNNRDPQEDEAEACRPYLEAQIRLVKPKLILAVGRVAAQRLLGTTTALGRLRGELHAWGQEGTPLWITYHPAFLLRSPRDKVKAWQDLKWVYQYLAAKPVDEVQ